MHKKFLYSQVLLSVPFIFVFFVILFGKRIYFLGDQAIIEHWLRHMPFGDFPLDGLYSRFGWRHLGPVYYYATYPLYILFGRDSKALLLATLTQSYILVFVAGYILNRIKFQLSIIFNILILVWFSLNPVLFYGPWNPNLAVFLFCIFFAIGFRICQKISNEKGILQEFILLTVVYSLLAQLHIAYVIICLFPVLLCLPFAIKHSKKDLFTKVLPINLIVWIPVIISNIVSVINGKTSNLQRIVEYSVNNDNQKIPVVSLKAMLHVGDINYILFKNNATTEKFNTWGLPLLIIVLVCCVAYSLLKGKKDFFIYASAFWGATFFGGLIFIFTSEYPLLPYLLFFQITMWIFLVLLIFVFLLQTKTLVQKNEVIVIFLFINLFLILIFCSFKNYDNVYNSKSRQSINNIATESVKVLTQLGTKKIIIRVDGTTGLGWAQATIVNEAERYGIEIFFQPEDELRYGKQNLIEQNDTEYFVLFLSKTYLSSNQCFNKKDLIDKFKIDSKKSFYLVNYSNWRCTLTE